MIIAVDGPAASGKGTVARRLAAHYRLAHLDTGALYRAVALALARAGAGFDDPHAAAEAAATLDPALTRDPEIRSAATGAAASRVASMPGVRRALRALQVDFAHHPPGRAAGAVLDGRDIGTVICPDADRKLYVTAALQIRAERRHRELLAAGAPAIYASVLEALRERDLRDAGRADAPMVMAEGALLLDTTSLDPDQAFAAARAFVESGTVS